MAPIPIILQLNLEYLKVLSLAPYYSLFTLTILKVILIPILSFLLMIPCFFSVVQDSVQSATDLNHDLDMISQWAHQWKMEFNPDPSKQATEVLFSCKKNRANHPQLIFQWICCC